MINKKIILINVVVVILSISKCFSFPCENWHLELKRGIEGYRPAEIPKEYHSGKFYEWKLQSCIHTEKFLYDEGEPGYSILNLWRAKRIDFLELLWWRSRQRETRLLILSLFLGNRLEDVSSIPVFDSSRFNEKESDERKIEIEYIKKHREFIHNVLKKNSLLLTNQLI